ncbi:MAG: hypothetical protein A3E78_12210 [Alphaproteobacteria bacterium RIFCSPHIGHO2_12_FULL_63_12]|nr:MAG: hypothetical protein A3E78_12210 [Alphaproteobacteria bacterium RIFCSPHIGHO2_12_FULL_63_12]
MARKPRTERLTKNENAQAAWPLCHVEKSRRAAYCGETPCKDCRELAAEVMSEYRRHPGGEGEEGNQAMTGNPKDGGPAFPAASFPLSGMTLLQWYAGQALAGMMGGSPHLLSVFEDAEKTRRLSSVEAVARLAFDQAAAMIAEWEKRRG